VTFPDFQAQVIRAVFDKVRAGGRTQLTLAEAQRVIDAAGISMARWIEAANETAAVEAATAIGFPVALKVSSAALVHKSEGGGVRLGLKDADAVRQAASTLLAAASAVDPQATLIVQRMIPGGVEIIFGASVDPKFGPLMMFGLGGIFVEVLKDVAFRLQPITDVDADEMLRSIRSLPILTGARGSPAVDLQVIRNTLLRLNQLLTEFPEIEEFDVNPFFAVPAAATSLAADARIRLTAGQ
jgi:acyl-CoA synthetase (NDP forming)